MVSDFETGIPDEEASKFKASNTTEGTPESAPEIEEKKPIPEMVVSQEKYDKQQRLSQEHKAGYKDLSAKENGEANWVNNNRYSYDDKNRKIEETKTGYKNEEAFIEGKMQWGHKTDFAYDDENNKVMAESQDLKNKDVTWQEETKYGPDGWRKIERSGQKKVGDKVTATWIKKYSYAEEMDSHRGQRINVIKETEDGEETASDGTKKTWQKIVVYDVNKNHLKHSVKL